MILDVVNALPFRLPIIGFVTVRFANVPTEVREENKTFGLSVLPVKVLASADTTISTLPSNATPLIFFDACNAEAVVALPAILPTIGFVTVRLPKVPTDVSDELITFGASVLPINAFAFTAAAAMGVTQVGAEAPPLL